MDRTATSVLSGLLFGAGLALSEMTEPARVKGFLDVTGTWDPTLVFVIGAALGVSALANAIERGRRSPAPAAPDTLPARGIDGRLLLGATLFGVGWGLVGFCPGPALAALVTGSTDVLLFVAAMLVGMGLFERLPDADRPGAPSGTS